LGSLIFTENIYFWNVSCKIQSQRSTFNRF